MSILTTLVAYRVSIILLAAVLAFAIVELIALLALSGRTRWIPTSWNYVTHPLTGEDGRLSFTKLFAVFIALLYAVAGKDFMPAVVACFLISASFGAKMLLALIQSKSATVVTTEVATPAVKQTTVETKPPQEVL
jgi:hypothetical protein